MEARRRKSGKRPFWTRYGVLCGISVAVLLIGGVVGYSVYHSFQSSPCGDVTKTAGLTASSNPQLRKLAQYQDVCNGNPASRLAVFTATPRNTAEATSYAEELAGTLQDYRRHHVAPLVFLEPASDTGEKIDLDKYAAGAYDEVLADYFNALQSAGLASQDVGMWVMLPEGNIPEWSSVDPDTYARVVTKTAQAFKTVFPTAQAAILLDSRSYADMSYQNPQYVSLRPYIAAIPLGLIDSVGLQAYPGSDTQSAETYMRTDLLAEAADILHVTDVWISTGTFASLRDPETGKVLQMTSAERYAALRTTLHKLSEMQTDDLRPAVMLFAEDKSDTTEATDWSYWQGDAPAGHDVRMLQWFIKELQAGGLQFWLYDS